MVEFFNDNSNDNSNNSLLISESWLHKKEYIKYNKFEARMCKILRIK